MNSKSTWFLLVLAAGLFAFIFFFERPLREARQRPAETLLFPSLTFSNLTALQIRPAGRFDILVEKTNDSWRLIKPIDYPANTEFLEALVTNLASLQWRTRITSEELKERPNAQEEFGMSEPQFSIKIQTKDSEQNILVGSKGVIGNEVFVQFVGGEGLYLVDSAWMNLLPRRPEDWRDPSVFPASILGATSIELRAGTRSLKFDLNPTNQFWRMLRPIEARANNQKIISLLTNLTDTRIAAYVAEDMQLDLDQFGLPGTPGTPPQLELAFFQGTNLISGLQIGNSLTNALDYAFAKHLERDVVFVVPKAPFDGWLLPHAEFRDRRLTRFNTNKIERFDVRGAEHFSIIHRADGKWDAAYRDTFPADPEAINDMLFVLSNVDMTFENDVVTDFSTFGLTNPIVEYTISGQVTNAILGRMDIVEEHLRFGTNETGKVFVRRNDESRVYSMHPQEFSLFPRSSWHLRDKQIWQFVPSNVVSVLIEQHGKSRKLVRRGENEWSIAEGYQGIINNPFLLEEALYRLGQLRAVFWTAHGELPNDPYGIKENNFRLTIEVQRDGKTELLQVSFGDFSPFKLPYASTVLKGETVVFEFPIALYLEFIRRDLSIVPAPLPPQ